jgi:cation diffusion facilitator family transporter
MYGSLAANIFLFVCQLTAAILSGSLVFFATTADAFMDLASSSVLIYTGILASKEDYMKYPTGKAKYKTAGIIIFSTLMCTLSLQIFVESIKRLIDGESALTIDIITYLIIGIAFVLKLSLFLYCSRYSHIASITVLAQDHRNDVIFNSTGVILGIIASKTYWWLDPIGAMLIGFVILRSWAITAREQIFLIVGKSADSDFLNRVVYITMTHDDRIEYVDTCRAYHSGSNVFVEVDVMFPPDMPLHEAHDIGESLQYQLETLEEVDRAFVHLDYETSHTPEHRKSK